MNKLLVSLIALELFDFFFFLYVNVIFLALISLAALGINVSVLSLLIYNEQRGRT
jgi:hypothetical protein